METLIQGVIGMGQEPGRIVMMLIGGLLMYLGIKKEYEPTLLVPYWALAASQVRLMFFLILE